MFIWKVVQKESFTGLDDNKIKCLKPKHDEHDVIRMRSQVWNRPDETVGFRNPILLPSKSSVVRSLIWDLHIQNCHVGVQGLLALTRERYWILAGRRTIKTVLKKCAICQRFEAKPYVVEPPPLPIDRVRDAVPFEITGVDFAGPLFLKSGEKAWICLFTCAIYRCIHLELTLTLSSNGFLQVLRRFVARRGRPNVMYSDNGTNFRGTDNAFKCLNWDEIERQTKVRRITWRFNPPTAAWWGGFFERLVGLVKSLLKRVLGRAHVNFEDLLTLLCDCESVINNRPLTYIGDDPSELLPLTPAMFLREQVGSAVPDIDIIERGNISRKLRYKQTLRDHLRVRFRSEYLGQLRSFFDKKPTPSVRVDQLVLIKNDFKKRVEWPLGRVIEIIPEKDGHIRLVRVNTASGEMLRPVQRLCPLEVEPSDDTNGYSKNPPYDGAELTQREVGSEEIKIKSDSVKVTKRGREVRRPKKFLD